MPSIFNFYLFVLISGAKKLPCLLGWEMAMHCAMQLWDFVREEYAVKFLLVGRINQDCVENLFSVIRGKGGQRDNPDAAQFRSALAQVNRYRLSSLIRHLIKLYDCSNLLQDRKK